MSKCVVTATDRDYFMATEVMLRSLDANYSGGEKLDVFVLVPQKLADWQFYKTEFKNLNIRVTYSEVFDSPEAVEVVQRMYGDRSIKRITAASMLRFFIGDILPVEYKTAIYIDPDTVIARDISPLLNYELKTPLAAMPELQIELPANPSFADSAHFNSGVMVIDVKYWRVAKASKLLLRTASKFNDWTGSTDQDILNYAFKGNWTPLPISFNYLINIYPDWTIEDPLVVHWAGQRKPWSNAPNTKWRALWKTYRMQGPTTMS